MNNLVGERLRNYELVIVLSPEATEEEVTATLERVDGMISDGGGTISERENWGVRRLAYPINKFGEGNYVLTRFEVDASAIAQINQRLQGSADLLRYLVIRP